MAVQCCDSPCVIVTGFGPFGQHSVNNSWTCVQLLKSSSIESELSINLVIQEIPVVYKEADQIVPSLWKTHNPVLVIHVGVHGEDTIVVEKQANRRGYSRLDVENTCPADGCSSLGEVSTICTGIDVDSIMNCSNSHCSTDAGRFLCEYTYYLSLAHDPKRSLFVHVPPATSEVSQEYIASQLKIIVREALCQLGYLGDSAEKIESNEL